MTKASKPCNTHGCHHLQPCPTHPTKAWAGSTRRTKTGSGSQQQKRAAHVLHRDNGICHICGQPGANQADHIIPLAEGGIDHVRNMAAIHDKPCHQQKTQAEAQRARARAKPIATRD